MNENTFSSRLQLLNSVQEKLNGLEFDINQSKPFRRYSDSDDNWIPVSRSDVELFNQTLNDAAGKFGIKTQQIVWDEQSVSVHGDPKTDVETVQELLTEWRTWIRFAVFASGELPKGWEISDSNIPQNPIQNGSDLAGWLNCWLSWIAETRESGCLLAGVSINLADFQRELRNARRAIHAFKIPLSFAFDKDPENVNDAEDKLRRLIDELNIVDGNGGQQQTPQVEASEQGRDATVQAGKTEPAALNGNSVNGGNVPEWLPPQSVTRLIKETGCSRTTINHELRYGSIPGGSKRESNKPRGHVIITAIGLQYLKRKGGKSERDQR